MKHSYIFLSLIMISSFMCGAEKQGQICSLFDNRLPLFEEDYSKQQLLVQSTVANYTALDNNVLASLLTVKSNGSSSELNKLFLATTHEYLLNHFVQHNKKEFEKEEENCNHSFSPQDIVAKAKDIYIQKVNNHQLKGSECGRNCALIERIKIQDIVIGGECLFLKDQQITPYVVKSDENEKNILFQQVVDENQRDRMLNGLLASCYNQTDFTTLATLLTFKKTIFLMPEAVDASRSYLNLENDDVPTIAALVNFPVIPTVITLDQEKKSETAFNKNTIEGGNVSEHKKQSTHGLTFLKFPFSSKSLKDNNDAIDNSNPPLNRTFSLTNLNPFSSSSSKTDKNYDHLKYTSDTESTDNNDEK